MSAGKGWSRALLFVGAAASLSANVRHSFIPPKPDGASAERWREYAAAYVDYAPAPESVVWAALVVLAAWMSLEAIVRIRWDSHRVWGWLIKGLLSLSVFAVALWASYGHGSSLLEYAGEDKFMIMFGPLLPDGMMLLGTAGLLLAGVRDKDTAKGPSLAERVRVLRTTAVDTVAAARGQGTDVVASLLVPMSPDMPLDTDTKDMWTSGVVPTPLSSIAQVMSGTTDTVDMDMLPVGMDTPTQDKTTSKRAVSWDKDKATDMIKDTVMNDADIAAAVGVSSKTIQRLRKAIRAELGLS